MIRRPNEIRVNYGTIKKSYLTIIITLNKSRSYLLASHLFTNKMRLTKEFLKKISFQFKVRRLLISNRGHIFFSNYLDNLMSKCNVKHKATIFYDPQISVQVEVSNKQLKLIFEKIVNALRKKWPKKLHDALDLRHI